MVMEKEIEVNRKTRSVNGFEAIYIYEKYLNGEILSSIAIKERIIRNIAVHILSNKNKSINVVKESKEKLKHTTEFENIVVNINDVILPRHFAATPPKRAKIIEKLRNYKKTGKLNPVIVTKDMILVDGFKNYMVYKYLNVEEIPIQILN
jgi:hypothetical protein